MTILPFLASSVVVLSNSFGRVEIDLHGAKLLSYVPAGSTEVIAPPQTSNFKPQTWVHGGVPVCWPWFYDKGPDGLANLHGTARNADFTVISKSPDAVTLEYIKPSTVLRFVCELGERLKLRLVSTNNGSTPVEITEGLHAYFLIRDPAEAQIDGLKGVPYTTKRYSKTPEPSVCSGPMSLKGANDIYDITAGTFIVSDRSAGRDIVLTASGMEQLTIWNGETCPAGMVCVEPIIYRKPIVLGPGQTHEMVLTVAWSLPVFWQKKHYPQ